MWGGAQEAKTQRPDSEDTISYGCRTPTDFKGFTSQNPGSVWGWGE